MPKFSIIVPVYNVEKYIDGCIKSIMSQSYKDYEVIVVDDGSSDGSINIVKKYKDIKVIKESHLGVSHARNVGVSKAVGDYLLFVDSDDAINKDLLLNISKGLDNNPSLVRFQVERIVDNGVITKYPEEEFYGLNGVAAFSKIVNYHYVENAWCYAYNRKYYISNKFMFKEGTIHEDFGLIPLVIIKSSCVNSIGYIGYNYYRRIGSIMTNNDYDRVKVKVNDFYNHYIYLRDSINKTNLDKKVFLSFISNSLILKICELKGRDYKYYKRLLKKEKVFDNILDDTFSRRIKKFIFRLSPKVGKKLIGG